MYEYRAVIVSVHDGDTVKVDVDLGWGVWLHAQDLRLNRINAPELHTDAGGPASQEALATLLPIGSEVVVRTMKDKTEKYGRMLAELYLASDLMKLNNVNDTLVKQGFALYWNGHGKRPV